MPRGHWLGVSPHSLPAEELQRLPLCFCAATLADFNQQLCRASPSPLLAPLSSMFTLLHLAESPTWPRGGASQQDLLSRNQQHTSCPALSPRRQDCFLLAGMREKKPVACFLPQPYRLQVAQRRLVWNKSFFKRTCCRSLCDLCLALLSAA